MPDDLITTRAAFGDDVKRLTIKARGKLLNELLETARKLNCDLTK